MKTMKKNKFLQFGLIVLAAICAFLCFGTKPPKQSVSQAAGKAGVTSAYIGDLIEAKDYKMLSAGNDVVAEGMRIVYPSGGIYSSDKFSIEQAGKYEVTYYATVNGERVEETKTYMAIRRPQDMIVADSGMTVEYGMFNVKGSPFELKKQTYGALVHFKAGQSITFATNLKTSDLTEGFNFLEMIVQPSVYGETDFEKLTVRLTDVGNENNYVEYIIVSSNLVDGGGMTSYVRAGAVNRQYGGWEGSTFHLRSYGTSVEHSFRGWGCLDSDKRNQGVNTLSENPLTLAIDNDSKKVYCGPYSPTSSVNNMVNDLDDETRYKSDPWGGFTGEEVSVTIKAESFAKSEGVLMITSYGGYNFARDIVDNKAPEIKFEYDMTGRLPVAEVGSNFPIIPFVAKDNLDKEVKTNVWVNYINENGKKITVENDGESFFVNYAGTYEIIYNAEDYSGNVAEKCITIKAEGSAPNIYVGMENALVEKDVYDIVSIPYASDINVYGGSGSITIERAVYSPSKKLLDVKDSLQLVELGDYKVVYTATDYYGNVGYGVVTIRSNGISGAKMIEGPTFIDALLSGFTYEFPQALFIETIDGEIIKLPYSTYVNGELLDGSFVAAGEEMTIRYVAEGQTGTAEWEETIVVVDAEEGKYKSRYFYTKDDLNIVDEKNYLDFKIEDDAKATFINALSTESFSINLEYQAENINFSQMAFILTDAADQELSVTFYLSYNKAEGQWYLQMNDSASKVKFAESKGILSFIYSHSDKRIIDASGEAITQIMHYDNGQEFAGFSEMVYYSVAFEGVKNDSSIWFTKVGNQSMGYNKSSLEKAEDETKPIIVLDEVFLFSQRIGTKALIPTGKAYDVLGQIKEFVVEVSLNGLLLASGDATQPLDLMLDKAGYYSVTYIAKDTNGNRAEIPYKILVADEITPTLTVKDNLKDTYKSGDKIKIPTYSATDNGENCYIQVMVLLPDNEMRLLHYSKNGEVTSLLDKDNSIYNAEFKAGVNTFVTDKKGKYVLRFVAYDDYYNYTVQEIVFWVK